MLRRNLVCSLTVLLLLLAVTVYAGEPAASSAPSAAAQDPLIQVLVSKGVITADEAKFLAAGNPGDQRDKLILLLKEKGLLSAAETDTLRAPAAGVQATAVVATPAPAQNVKAAESKPAPPKFVPAVAPLRVLQLEPSKKDGLIPDIKLGSGARIKLYGMVKASTIYDSSSPYGTDMPLPGFIGNTALASTFDTGPGAGNEFHVKARFARVGANFEFPDVSPKLTFTGKFEFDFEGNFTRTLNRNISTIRSSQASIRLAYGRMDYKINDSNGWWLVAGQDWTPFGSSTLPNLVETTGLGLGFGTLYERDPQFRFGFAHTVAGNSRKLTFAPEVAVVLPAYGNDPKIIDDQLGYGERQGADSGRPEVQGRFVTQWQLDKAPGVLPAQLIASFVQGSRKAIIRKDQVPLCAAVGCPNAAVFQTAFPNGAEVSTDRWGYSTEIQLPTRYVTLIGKYWRGADLRWYFVGSLLSVYNDTAGLNVPTASTSIDGGTPVFFALNGTTPIVVPQEPVRSQGGFVNLGFPLGRIFKADPAGHNAGWQMYFHYAFDNTFSRDARKTGALGSAGVANQRGKNDLGAGTLMWKVNPFVTFALEESYYRTRLTGGATPWGSPTGWGTWMGKPARSWHDMRSEFSTIFTF